MFTHFFVALWAFVFLSTVHALPHRGPPGQRPTQTSAEETSHHVTESTAESTTVSQSVGFGTGSPSNTGSLRGTAFSSGTVLSGSRPIRGTASLSGTRPRNTASSSSRLPISTASLSSTSQRTSALLISTSTQSTISSASSASVYSTSTSSISSTSSTTTSVHSTTSFSAATSTTSQASSTISAVPKPSQTSPYLRGVNIGGWLVLEKWMTSDLFDGTSAIDQYTFDQTSGASSKLQKHWSTYFTEADVEKIASWGINALRIPIGYWAYDNSGTSYISGADEYLDKAIGWARKHGLQVLVDCHGSPGSQNGFDNSGQAGSVNWQKNGNLDKSTDILKKIATKYGSQQYADVVYGIELVNEPISWGANDFEATKRWAQDAYKAVKAASTNANLKIVMHDGFMGPSNWKQVGQGINNGASLDDASFVIDTHLYQNQVDSDSTLTQDQHIKKACNWGHDTLLDSSSKLPVLVGEFSLATNICANPDGSTVAGNSCSQDGCQCSASVPIDQWKQPLIQATRKFVEAEMDAFENSASSTKGHFLWSYKGPGGWGLENAVKYGLVGSKITDRKFPGQCK